MIKGRCSEKLRTVKDMIEELERYDPDTPVRVFQNTSLAAPRVLVAPRVLFTCGKVFFVPSSIKPIIKEVKETNLEVKTDKAQ